MKKAKMFYLTHYDGRDCDTKTRTPLGIFTTRTKALAALKRAKGCGISGPLLSELPLRAQNLADLFFEIEEVQADKDWW